MRLLGLCLGLALSFQISSAEASKLYQALGLPIMLNSKNDIWAFSNQNKFSDPVQITNTHDVNKVAGFAFTDKNGDAFIWGIKNMEERHLNPNEDSQDFIEILTYRAPIKINGIKNIIDISSEDDYYIAVDRDGNIYEWHFNGFEENASMDITPKLIASNTKIYKVKTNGNVNIAQSDEKSLIGWGKLGYLGLDATDKYFSIKEARIITDDKQKINNYFLLKGNLLVEKSSGISYWNVCHLVDNNYIYSYKEDFLHVGISDIQFDMTHSYYSPVILRNGNLQNNHFDLSDEQEKCQMSMYGNYKNSFFYLKGFNIVSFIDFGPLPVNPIKILFLDSEDYIYSLIDDSLVIEKLMKMPQ